MLQSTDYSHKLRELEFLDISRKSLIRLAIIRAKTFSPINKEETNSEKISNSVEEGNDHSDVQNKALDYERRIAALKSQLATKDQVYEAKIDGFKQLISRLQNQLESQSHMDPTKKTKMNSAPAIPSSPSRHLSNSSFFSPARTSSVFNFASPFGNKTGKGNSFSVSGINSSIASQASLKLSKEKVRDEEVFSPNNSSAEATPKKAQNGRTSSLNDSRPGNLNRELMRLSEPSGKNPDTSDAVKNGIETDDINAESSNLDLSIARLDQGEDGGDETSKPKDVSFSEHEEMFQSANGTFDNEMSQNSRNLKFEKEKNLKFEKEKNLKFEKEKNLKFEKEKDLKSKKENNLKDVIDIPKENPKRNTKKRIRLFSSEASKILVESQSKINDEDTDPNSLNYYEDDNFKDDFVSPTRPLKRNIKEERTDKTTKKRHVFKI